MRLTTIRTGEEVVPAGTTSTVLNGTHHLAMVRGHAITIGREVASAVIAKDLLERVYDKVPSINASIRRRESSWPWEVMWR